MATLYMLFQGHFIMRNMLNAYRKPIYFQQNGKSQLKFKYCVRQALQKSEPGMRFNRGFTLVELTIVLAIASMLALYTLRSKVLETDQAIAKMVGLHVDSAGAAAEAYLIANYLNLSTATPVVAGIADPLAPTLAELKNKGHLATNFPSVTPLGQLVNVRLMRTGCPGASCSITALAYTTSALVTGVNTEVRYDLVVEALQAMKGRGSASYMSDGANLRSSIGNLPNPMGNVEGILASSGMMDNTLYTAFVRMGDTRDPSLAGNLTVQGNIVGGTITSNNTIAAAGSIISGNQIAAQNDIGTGLVGCLKAALKNDGKVIASSMNCVSRVWMDGATGTVNVADATGVRRAVMDGTNAEIAALNPVGNVAASIKGDGVVFGDKLIGNTAVIQNQAVVGAACTIPNAVERGLIGSNPTLLMCHQGFWRSSGALALAVQAASCSINGALGANVAGVTMICQQGVWLPLATRFGRFAVVDTFEVWHGMRFPVGTCSAGGFEKIYFVPQGIETRLNPATNKSAVNFRADVSQYPGEYLILADYTVGAGDTVAEGDPSLSYGVAIVGCFYD